MLTFPNHDSLSLIQEVLKTFSNTSDKTDQRMFERFFPVTNITEALDRVALDADFAVMEGGKYLQYAAKVTYFNGYSSALHITKECPTTYNVGFVMPIGSPYYDRVNVVRLELTTLTLKYKFSSFQFQ